jgi:hypothetical protein
LRLWLLQDLTRNKKESIIHIMKAIIEILENDDELTQKDIIESLNGFELEFDAFCNEREEDFPVKVKITITNT